VSGSTRGAGEPDWFSISTRRHTIVALRFESRRNVWLGIAMNSRVGTVDGKD
jgi:hypothetical protein